MNLSNEELLKQVELSRRQEHEALVALLVYLGELDRRKLFLGLGYSSLFAYCTKKLKFSEPAAFRRISGARVIKRFPQALRLLRTKEINLTTLSLIHSIISDKTAKEIFETVIGKSKAEVEQLVARFRAPKSAIRESIRPVAVEKVIAPKCSQSVESNDKITFSGESDSPPLSSNDDKKLALKFKVSFSVEQRVVSKLKRIREIRPYKNLEEIFEILVDDYLKRKAPENKRESERKSDSRYVPIGLRAKVLKRDGFQCSFIGERGQRCECRSDLEIDHIHPIAFGGKTELSNLRTLCAAHNRYEARRLVTNWENDEAPGGSEVWQATRSTRRRRGEVWTC